MINNKRTKIIATIGPASQDRTIMIELMKKGVNIFRFNMKHGENSWHSQCIKQAREISNELNHNLGILIDLQGPEIRIKTFNSQIVSIKEGDLVEIYFDINDLKESEKSFAIPIPTLQGNFEVGDRLAIDDGAVFLEIVEVNNKCVARSLSNNVIKNNKSLNLIGKDVDLPSLTDIDRNRLQVALEGNVDFVALSFVRQKEDVITLKNELKKMNLDCKVISKIESKKGVDNIEEIIDESYGIMIARGDLGIETPIEGVTYIQKEIIKKCKNKSTPVIVATQMLESMTNAKFPTRAEAGDVANAVFDSTDAVMLSGETANGIDPVNVVEYMNRICMFNEFVAPETSAELSFMDNSAHIAVATLSICRDSKINKIIALTETGYTTRVISAHRPKADIIAVSEHQDTINLLSMSRGVFAFRTKYKSRVLTSYQNIIDELLEAGLVSKGEHVVAIHGQKFGQIGGTNSLIILEI